MNCVEIIKKYLEENGFEGLYNFDVCACEINDIVPCSRDFTFCQPGYRTDTPGGEYDFEIGPDRAKDTT